MKHIDPIITNLSMLETINLAFNKLSEITIKFSQFVHLRELNLSHNCLVTLSPRSMSMSPSSLDILDLRDNPWECAPSLAWIYSWSRSFPHIVKQLRVSEII